MKTHDGFRHSYFWLAAITCLCRCSDNGPPERSAPNATGKSGNSAAKQCLDLATVQSWQGAVGTIFEANCGSCHPGQRPTDYASYRGVAANIAMEMVRIDNNSMPPGSPLSPSDKSMIHAWVNAGMPETDTAIPSDSTPLPVPTCEPSSINPTPTASPTPTPWIYPNQTALPNPTPPLGLAKSWDSGIGTLFTQNCGSCHDGRTQTTHYDTYAGVKANISAEQLRISSGSMPPSAPLSSSDQALINAWVQAGMPQSDSPTPTTTPAPTSAPGLIPTYSGGIQAIIAANCGGCHSSSAGGRATSPYLDTLSSLKSNYSSVMSAIKSGSMPRGGATLPQNQMDLLTSWGTAPNSPYGRWAP